jgi:ferredoxin
MRVQVDHDQCEGHGRCQLVAPAVFELREDDLSYVRVSEVPDDLTPLVERAIRWCPKQAISWFT